MILYTLVFITLIGLILILQGSIEDEGDVLVIGWIILIINLIYGWIIAGTCINNYTLEIKQNPIEILKGKHIGVLVFETKTFMIKGYELEKVNDKSVYYYKIGYNIYNYTTDTTLIIK
jgi:hypothetical protein